MRTITNGFALSRAELKALLAHASTDTFRTYMCGVWLEPAVGRAFATDGHRLAVCQAAPAAGDAFLLPRDSVEQIARATRKASHVAHVTRSGETATVRVLDSKLNEDAPAALVATVTVPVRTLADVAPPPIDQVVPPVPAKDAPASGLFGVNADYLADIALVTAACERRVAEVAVFPPASETDPIAFRASGLDGTSWTVVVMPMRIGDPRKSAEAKEAA